MDRGELSRSLGLTAEQAAVGLGLASEVVSAGGGVGARGRALLGVLERALGVTPGERGGRVDVVFEAEHARARLVDALVVAACIEGEVSEAGERAVQAIERRLGVRSRWARLLPALRRGQVLAVKRALVASAPDGRRLLERTWREEGVRGLVRAVAFVLGHHRDDALAARFRGLAACPEGSLGRVVTEHFRARRLAFPGEAGGIPERMFHHDLMHVVNGYDTDPAGECELAGFYAGFAGGESFTFLVIALATFHLGLRVSPSVVEPARGAFDPARVAAAFVRGRGLRVDVMGRWDYWALMPLPLDEARARLGLHVPSCAA